MQCQIILSSMKTSTVFKINRSGVVKTNHTSKNQCKDVGHKKYEYEAKVTVGSKLDKDGFVIDHADIHKAVEKLFKKGISSCEMMAHQAAMAIVKACKKHGCKVKKVYVKIKPVGADVKAFMETEVKIKR